MTDPTHLVARTAALLAVCKQILDDTRALTEEQRRIRAIFLYENDDSTARAIARKLLRGWPSPTKLPPRGPGASALVFLHRPLVHALRAARFEISDAEDPGAGRICCVGVVGRRCVRWTLVADAAAAGQEEELLAAIDAFPSCVLNGLHHAVQLALELPDEDRRRRAAIVVCEIDDAKACAMARALCAATAVPQFEPRPAEAAVFVEGHTLVANLARSLGYEVRDLPDPAAGRMRAFVFAGGRVLADSLRVADEDYVPGTAAEEEESADRAYCRRILDQKEPLIRRAVSVLLSDEKRRLDQIVVVFGARSDTAHAMYAELRELPENRDFPPDLPPGVPVIVVGYDDFMARLHRRGPRFRGIDASKLGPNQVRVAVFTPSGVIIHGMESLPFARGGSS